MFCLLKGIAEGTYNTKHAEAAKLYGRAVENGPTNTLTSYSTLGKLHLFFSSSPGGARDGGMGDWRLARRWRCARVRAVAVCVLTHACVRAVAEGEDRSPPRAPFATAPARPHKPPLAVSAHR